MKKLAAALAALLAIGSLGGATVLAGSAQAQQSTNAAQTMHTRHVILHEMASHDLGKFTFSGTDKVRSRSGRVIGFDTFTGRFHPRAGKAVLWAAFALRDGILNARVTFTGDGQDFHGRITGGTGKFLGARGTIDGTSGKVTRATLRYTL